MFRGRLATMPGGYGAVLTVRTWGLGILAYGLVVALQGQRRWQSPTLTTANHWADWLPGDPCHAWGAAFAVAGMLTVAGSVRASFPLRNLGLYSIVGLSLLLGVTTTFSALSLPNASFAGGVLYLTIAVAASIVARVRT